MTTKIAQVPYGAALPNSWDAVPLKYLASLTNGYVFKPGDMADNGTPVVRIENLNGSSRYNYSGLELPRKYQVGCGDLLYAWSGNPGTSFGPFRWEESGSYFLNQHIFKIGVQACDQNWLYWSLKAATHWIERELTSGMIGMVHVTKEELSGVLIPIPPVEEQRRIADFLDAETSRIDGLCKARTIQLSLIGQRWESAINGQLAHHATRMVELRRLGVRVTTGPFGTAFNASEYEVDGIPMINPVHIADGRIFPDSHHTVSRATAARLSRHLLRGGDLVVGRKGDIGRSALVRPEQDGWVCGSDSIALHSDPNRVRPEFLSYTLRSQLVRSQLLARSLAATMPSLSEGNLLSLRVPEFSLEQQDLLVANLDHVNEWAGRAADRMRSQLKLLAERRQGLVTAAVTGQFDVASASGRGMEG